MTVKTRRVAPGVHILDVEKSGGWRVSMPVLSLPGGGSLLYSPTWAGEGTFEAVSALGAPRALVAPNHFHHLALGRYAERFPEARQVASEGATPRLRSLGHASVSIPAVDASLYGDAVAFHPCEGTRSGEMWCSVKGEDGVTLAVCDAFFNVPGPLTGVFGALLRATKTGPGLMVGRTFKTLALRDRALYRRWARETLEALRPTRVVFCHGDTLEGDDLAERMLAATDERLG